ncbi:patatin-like phospholipase family protein [Burkholderia vietnamiensis]|uniref:patatin-like phospholipase family protein n=1 Tax=Burkholderia vietnamiensis TaxID=60552 RepID=UPI001CF4B2A9|nr:patatin-like phospholipase family protein [Burkholderia vietnamiensis]MCA8287306.1 patatin-like phospholipase family protein [Burkholderia vietnamiensis]
MNDGGGAVRKGILLLLAVSPILFGCVVGGVPSHLSQALPPCEKTSDKLDCILNTNSGVVEELKPNKKPLPTLGLALSGGGSKASPFAMGVVKRFVDEGWLYRTDYLTSVSGGSYTAFYLYYKAYRAILDDVPVIRAYPGLTRYFMDTRNLDSRRRELPYVWLFSPDEVHHRWDSLAELPGGCTNLGPVPTDDPRPTDLSAPVWKNVQQAAYQGWVECYQDLLRTDRAQKSKYKDGVVARTRYANQLGGTFAILFAESLATAPVNWFTNVLFDWKWRVSPTQYDYLYGIMRTYGYMPQPGDKLPVSPHAERFKEMAGCLDFSDLSIIYTHDPNTTKEKLGGYLPKWIIQATANSGNTGLDLSPKHYDLSSDVFEISFDMFGSGRYGYVRGSPWLVGLTVPMAVLSSAAFADTAQRSIHISRGLVNFGLQTINLRWGFDIANYNEPDIKRRLHSLLIWPFYYLDSPVTTEKGPTIHLSDGGQTGDNLGLVPLLRRGVRNIVAVAGENDYDPKSNAMLLASLCSVNYYLNVHGYTMDFDGDPSLPTGSGPEKYHLAQKCTWDGNRQIYVHPTKDGGNISPMNWRRRVWVGHVVPYTPGVDGLPLLQGENLAEPEVTPKHLDGITVYYINSAMDQEEWMKVVDDWFPPDPSHKQPFLPKGKPGNPARCDGTVTTATGTYNCPLIEYFQDTTDAVQNGDHKWVFPQTSTAFTTYSNSINLFRAYRDLGWLYAGDLPNASPELGDILLHGQANGAPDGLSDLYDQQKHRYPKDEQVCKRWRG